jgi:hypothetical protein
LLIKPESFLGAPLVLVLVAFCEAESIPLEVSRFLKLACLRIRRGERVDVSERAPVRQLTGALRIGDGFLAIAH